MGSMTAGQQKQFHDRIHRIHSGGPNTNGQLYIGVGDSAAVRGLKRRKKSREGSIGKDILMLPVAILAGAAGMLAGRIGAFHLLADPSRLPEEHFDLIVLVADIGIAVGALALLAIIFSLGRTVRLIGLMAGVIGVMLWEPLIIQQAPDAFAQVFSEGYVTASVASIPDDPFSAAALGIDNVSVGVVGLGL